MIAWFKKLFVKDKPRVDRSLHAYAFGRWQQVTAMAICGPQLQVTTEAGETIIIAEGQANDSAKFVLIWRDLAGPHVSFSWEDGTPYEP